MYAGIGLIVIGEAIAFQAPLLFLYLLALWLPFHLFVVLYEEPTLKRRFGDEYERYRTMVPRWIPRLKPRPSTGGKEPPDGAPQPSTDGPPPHSRPG